MRLPHGLLIWIMAIVNRSAPRGTIVPRLIYDDGRSDGKVGHAQLAIGQRGVILGASRMGQRVRLARILRPPTTHVFGERESTAEDLAGYLSTFSRSGATAG